FASECLRQMHARFHISRQIRGRLSITQRGERRIRARYELAPQHAKLKAGPCKWEWRDIVVGAERPTIDGIRFLKALKVCEQRAERHQILEAAARLCDASPGGEDGLQVHAASLINRQRLALDEV